ncbi:MAG: hypothetical protein JWM72_4680 [Actinomycetia bacterium]|nr:hypothetical protein [Actinomycetes bacterium]
MKRLLSRAGARGTSIVICVFLAVRIVYWVTGGGFSTIMLHASWQLLDDKQLAAHPFQSVALLHIQPPLFNLFVGSVQRWSPLTTAVSLQFAYLGCGLVLVVALRLLLCDLGFAPWAATASACVVAVNPILLAYENTATYEYPVAALLVVSAVLCARYARDRRVATFTWFTITLTTIVLTRALLHPIWLILCMALVYVVVQDRAPARRYLAAIAIPLVLLGGWIVKNEVLFRQPTLSSWFGMNLARGVLAPLPRKDVDALIRSGELSAAARLRPLSSYDTYAPFFGQCKSSFRQDVVRSPTKHDGQSNFNAQCYLRVYDDAQHNALNAIASRPGAYLATRWPSAAQHFSLPTLDKLAPGADPFRHNTVIQGLGRGFDWLLLPVSATVDDHNWTVPLFSNGTRYKIRVSIVLALATLLVAIQGVHGASALLRRKRTPANLTWAYLGFTTIFITVISVATEYGENERFRVLLEPIVIGVLTAHVLTIASRLFRRLTTRDETHAHRPADAFAEAH